MKINRERAAEKLKTLHWSDLEWLRHQCIELEQSAKGGRFYSNQTHTPRETAEALSNHFESVFDKHHGGGCY